MSWKERTRESARAARTRMVVGVAVSLALGGIAAGCEVGAPPPDTASSQAMPPPPPPEYVASSTPVDYDGHATYWYGEHWYYRNPSGAWAYYHDEPPALHERRPAQQGPGRGAAFVPAGGPERGGAQERSPERGGSPEHIGPAPHGGAPPVVGGGSERSATRVEDNTHAPGATLVPAGGPAHTTAGATAPGATAPTGGTPPHGGAPPSGAPPASGGSTGHGGGGGSGHGSAPAGSGAPGGSGAPPSHSGGSGHGGQPPSGGSGGGGEHGSH